jgi:hypothetical protein
MINLDLNESEDENDKENNKEQKDIKQADEWSNINRIKGRSRQNTIIDPSKK